VLEPLLDLNAVLGDGRTVAEVCAAVRAAKPRSHPCLRSLEDPFATESGLVVLRGSLAPRGAVFKRSAAPRALWTHRGPAVVFDYHTAQARAQDANLRASPDCVIVLRNAGPIGHPAPETDWIPIPAVLRKANITERVCVTDGCMSGTEGGATALHVTPEAAVGGPIGLVRDGDEIALDATTGRLDLLVEDRKLTRRATEAPPSASAARRGYTSTTFCKLTRGATSIFWSTFRLGAESNKHDQETPRHSTHRRPRRHADLLAAEAFSSGDVSTSATAYYGAMQSPPTKILEQQIINLTGFSKSYYQTE
jgi:dihydroxyacid dehydratase/phosphogluconate dehydratase